MLGSLGIFLVIGGIAVVAIGALKKFEIETKTEFKIGDYETEMGVEFELEKNKEDKYKRKHGKRRGRDRPNFAEQPNQIDLDKPMLLVPENIYPYYNRDILV